MKPIVYQMNPKNYLWRWKLIEENIVKNVWGSRQFAQYLKEEDTFIGYNFVVDGGKKSIEELRKGDYLEVVEFSDFQVDALNGDIAGEIRLAYYRHDGVVEIVEQGSISGSMRELGKTMRFSLEQVQYDNRKIPAITRLQGVHITGVKQ